MTLKTFINGNYTLVWSMLLYLTGVYFIAQFFHLPAPEDVNGLLFSGIDQWLSIPWLSQILNSLLILLGGILLIRINNLYSIIPKRTLLPLIFFLLLEIASPRLSYLCNGNCLALVMLGLLFPLFSSYQQNRAQSAFLIMGVISTCTLFCSPIFYYIPLLLLGFSQIRYFNFKSVLGALLGLITPFWILLGIGVLSWNDLAGLLPSFSVQIPDSLPYTHPQFWIVVLTMILGAFSGTMTIYTTFTEKRQIRSYNGFITLLSIYTAILLLLDYTHYTTYLPMLNLAVSIQAAFFFTHNTKRVGVILFYFVLILYIGLFVWSLLPA